MSSRIQSKSALKVINKGLGLIALGVSNPMCKCAKISIEDVGYRSVGMNQTAYHKECGEDLSPIQVSIIDKQRINEWGLA